ncbi:MAG: MAPEG family protein [Gammaproteobacteria bacterium]|nr:MAPEG family protein [Gammaproteobacteria bacterium]
MLTEMPVPITAFYAALFGLLLIAVSARIPVWRRRLKVGIGSGGDEMLARLIRVHGNFTEYVPTSLILLVLNELNGSPMVLLHGAGITLLVGRIIHAFGLTSSSGYSSGRFWGTSLTWLVILVLSLQLLYSVLFPA